MRIDRRGFTAAAAAGLALPAVAQGQNASTLKVNPQIDFDFLDPR